MAQCRKQHVVATIVTSDGQRFVGTNSTLIPVEVCPRDQQGYPRGEGYFLCKNVCQQPAHAEVAAILAALAVDACLIDSTLYLEGHHACCPACLAACNAAGISQIVIGAPPCK